MPLWKLEIFDRIKRSESMACNNPHPSTLCIKAWSVPYQRRSMKQAEVHASSMEGETAFVPRDHCNLAYIIHFLLGVANLLPWNAFITAVDYFSYLYPKEHVNKSFAVAYMCSSLAALVALVATSNWPRRRPPVGRRINAGLSLFVCSLLVAPLLDLIGKHRSGRHSGTYSVMIVAVVACGLADGLVGGSLVGSTGELPKRYMHAVFVGTASSGVLVSVLRIITKASLPHDLKGLRTSTHIYFLVSIIIMIGCMTCYNILHKLPVMKYHKSSRPPLPSSELHHSNSKGPSMTSAAEASSQSQPKFWDVWKRIQWSACGASAIYIVTLSIFPGYITEDVHSKLFKDWYGILLIAVYNVFDLVGKSLTAAYLPKGGTKWALWCCVARFLFYPLFAACLHGPPFLRTEAPVIFLTSALGATNGYLTSVLMILTPKSVPSEESETAGTVLVMFLNIGLVGGSVLGWLWVI